jgi:exportin-T
MEAHQVEQAVEIAFNPTSGQDLKGQAMDFLNQLRVSTSAWQLCLPLFTRQPQASEVVRLVALDMLTTSIQTQQLDQQSLFFLKDNIFEYVRRVYGKGPVEEADSIAMQNKLTQVLTVLFNNLYSNGWESFFDDFLSLATSGGDSTGTKDNLPGVALYLRILSSVHDEIADVMIARNPEEQKRNTLLKDLVRDRDMRKIVLSWQEILGQWRTQNDNVVTLSLRVIAKWVHWVDISLVINEVLLNLIFQIVGRTGQEGKVDEDGATDTVRDAGLQTLTEIVGKKMQPADKMDLIVFLNLNNVVAQLLASPPLHDLRNTSNYDTDLAEAVAKLVNTAGVDIVRALDSSDAAAKEKADGLLQLFLPHALRLFSDEYDEVSSSVIPFLSDLLAFLRKSAKAAAATPPEYSAMLSPILNAIIVKMKYDDTSSWGDEDELTDEAEFQELRKRLKVLQETVAAIDEPLFIEVLSNVVGTTFETLDQGSNQVNWRDVDLALYEMFLFGETAVKGGGLYVKGKTTGPAADRLIEMMLKMVNSRKFL